MRAKTTVLIVSESPILATGMGETVRLLFGGLLDAFPNTYELHQVGLFHSYSVAAPRWPVYPTEGGRSEDGRPFFLVRDRYGEITFRRLVEKLQPDIVFAFNDPQRVLHLCDPGSSRAHKLVLYLNFDGLPFPPATCPILARADLIVTSSRFSRGVLLSAHSGMPAEKVDWMYAPADVSRFVPVAEEARAELRTRLLPDWMPQDAFVLGWVGRSQWRKQVWVIYVVLRHIRCGGYLVCEACGHVSARSQEPPPWARHHETPDSSATQAPACRHCGSAKTTRAAPLPDVFLWVHMPEEDPQEWSKAWLEERFDLRPGRDLHYTEGHRVEALRAPGEMPALYQAWDALLYTTGGEGFGLPPWEAMCCGVPSIYTNYSSHAEFLRAANAGLPIGGVLQPEAGSCIWRMIADAEQAVEAVRKLYFDRSLAKSLGTNGRQFVQDYAPGLQAHRWHDIFQRVLASAGQKGARCAC